MGSRRLFSNIVNKASTVPESKGLPIIGTMLEIMAAGGAPKLHLYIHKRHKEHGIIFREKLGPVPGVFVSDGNLMRKIFAAEGKYPRHIVPESWAMYNDIYKCKRGLLFMNGEEWASFRKPLNLIMLKNNDEEFTKATSIVARNLVQKWRVDGAINRLEMELYTWSLEVIVAILMGSETFQQHREEVSEEIKNLAKIVHGIFIESATLSLMSARLAMKLRLPVWKRFVDAVTSVTDSGRKLLRSIDDTCSKYPERTSLLHKIKKCGIENEDLDRIVIDLILAGGDTTSHTMQWILHLLSVNPNIQNILQNDVDKLEEADVTSCPILKGTLKEALRLYPVAPFITRYMPDNVVIDGYKLKKDELIIMSLYSSGRDESFFSDPNSFLPQRWIRNRREEILTNPYGSLPFAIGSRSCIGKKIAETQILVTLFHILKNFTVTSNHKEAIGITLHLISVPEKSINLIMKPRNESLPLQY